MYKAASAQSLNSKCSKFPHLKRREKLNAPVRDLSKRPPVRATSNIEIPGQGDTHRLKMKSKASSQTTDTVVAE